MSFLVKFCDVCLTIVLIFIQVGALDNPFKIIGNFLKVNRQAAYLYHYGGKDARLLKALLVGSLRKLNEQV